MKRVAPFVAFIVLQLGFASERSAFEDAIAASPAEDTPRLAYADWLAEHDEAERAEFIRHQVRIARLKEGEGDYWALHRRFRRLSELRVNLNGDRTPIADLQALVERVARANHRLSVFEFTHTEEVGQPSSPMTIGYPADLIERLRRNPITESCGESLKLVSTLG